MTLSISTTGKTVLAIILATAVAVPTLAVAKGGRHMERASFETLVRPLTPMATAS